MPVSPGASGMQPRGPCRPWRGTLASGHKPRCGLLALQSLESNAQLSFATRVEDWTCLGQHKRHPEFPVVIRESRRISRKTTWLPRHRKMKPCKDAFEGLETMDQLIVPEKREELLAQIRREADMEMGRASQVPEHRKTATRRSEERR